jgi:hypothetical protein
MSLYQIRTDFCAYDRTVVNANNCASNNIFNDITSNGTGVTSGFSDLASFNNLFTTD